MIDGVKRIGTNEWEVPVGFIPGMRVPGRFFLSESLGRILEPGAVQQARQCCDPARDYPALPCHAGYSLGLRFPYRGGRGILAG